MKTNVITFCLLTLYHLALCQHSNTDFNEKSDIPIAHSAYVQEIKNECPFTKLDEPQVKMTGYNIKIKESDVFDEVESYLVTFLNGKDEALAIYDLNGKQERAYGNYKDVRMPKK